MHETDSGGKCACAFNGLGVKCGEFWKKSTVIKLVTVS